MASICEGAAKMVRQIARWNFHPLVVGGTGSTGTVTLTSAAVKVAPGFAGAAVPLPASTSPTSNARPAATSSDFFTNPPRNSV